ncbi:uncharacterized protein LOC143847349 [Tasmannia lanceolata]|uniref:uncharacterized protein LOC143847349 n=1 Tax=Tasmannia lanceolata TaxID=3420 RepID=UPI004062E856
MDLLKSNDKVVRLKSHHNKYLVAGDDKESVYQSSSAPSQYSTWVIEYLEHSSKFRLKSCFSRYLASSHKPFLLGATGMKVEQTTEKTHNLDIEWEISKEEGFRVRLRNRYGGFLRANVGLPLCRNSVTHDFPWGTNTRSILWELEIVEVKSIETRLFNWVPSKDENKDKGVPLLCFSPSREDKKHAWNSKNSAGDGHSRIMYYRVCKDRDCENNNCNNIDSSEWSFLSFKGRNLHELREQLKKETGYEDLVLCTSSTFRGAHCPLHLPLPPGNLPMKVVLIPGTEINSET